MNGYCKILGGFFGAQPASDCPSDGYCAIEVYADGNPIDHGTFATEAEAEEHIAMVHAERLAENSQFGAGS